MRSPHDFCVRQLPELRQLIDTGKMRTLRALLLLVAGCSTDLVADPTSTPVDDPTSELAPAPGHPGAVQYGVDVCHVNAWTQIAGASDTLQIAVVPLDQGAAILSVPATGGAVIGFTIDQYGQQTGAATGSILRDGKFSSVRAGFVDGRLVAAIGDGRTMEVDALRSDLSDYRKLFEIEGTFAAQVPVTHARNTRIVPVASAAGVSYTTFDAQWQETHSVLGFRDQTIGMDAIGIGGLTGDTVTAWSTRNECHIERLVGREAWTGRGACASPRLAAHGSTATMAFERDGKIGVANLRGDASDLKSIAFLPELGHAPRVVFDGTRTWLSYLDAHGQVVVGFLGPDGKLVGRVLDESPSNGAYELAMINGAPWMVTANATGYYAYEMCVAPIGH